MIIPGVVASAQQGVVPLEYISHSYGAFPTHQVGDLLVCVSIKWNGNPTLISGFTSLHTHAWDSSGDDAGTRLMYKTATSTTQGVSGGTWYQSFVVRGASNTPEYAYNSSTTAPSVTPTNDSVLLFAHDAVFWSQNISCPVTYSGTSIGCWYSGTYNGTNSSRARATAHDTATGGVASGNRTGSGTANTRHTYTVACS